MKFSYKFSNLCGTVYKCGNVCFSADGNVLYSPVGNRVSVFDLVNHTSYTLSMETRMNISHICVSNSGRFMIAVDVEEKAIFVNLKRRTVLYRFSFERPVTDIQFSPDDSLIAVAMERKFQLWWTPSEKRHFAPLQKYLEVGRHFDKITSIRWSHNGDYLVTSSADMNVRIFSVGNKEGFIPVTLTGHRGDITGAFFTEDDLQIVSVASNGAVFEWEWNRISDEEWEKYLEYQNLKKRGKKYKVGRVTEVKSDNNESNDESEGEDQTSESEEPESESEKKGSESEEAVESNDESSNESENDESSDESENDESSNESENDESSNESENSESDDESQSTGKPAESNNDENTNVDEKSEVRESDFPVSIYAHGRWKIKNRYFINQAFTTITTCDYNSHARLLILGLSTGVFSLYEMPGFNAIHTLSISNRDISSCAINRSGDWLAFGCSTLGQLLVWEWQSETYVLKQQGHYHSINALEFSPDGSVVATGGDDGKVKLWSLTSGFCYVTFSEHTAAVTDLCYVRGGHAIVSSSLDGTVRAFDLVRYRNFRVLTTPVPVQFTCVTCDASGDLIAAGSNSPFSIYIWSLRTGKLLDTLTGHEGPISCLQFNSRGTQLASGSWDRTVRTWDLLGSGLKESLNHPAEVVSLDWRRDVDDLIVSCMNGSVYIWDAKEAQVKGTIDGRRDLWGGRKSTDVFTAEHNMQGKYFRSVCYSADGDFMIAAGHSKYVCIYSIQAKTLVKKYPLTQNRSLEGVLDKLNSKNMTEVGAVSELPDDTEEKQFLDPGVLKGDGAKRSLRDEIYCNAVKFSPAGDVWAAASSQGLMVYSLDPTLTFDPFDLNEDVTPDSIRYAIAGEEWSKALVYSLHLNEEEYIRRVLQSVPFDQVQIVCMEVPRFFLARLLQLLCTQVQQTIYLEYYITWILWLLRTHGEYLRANPRRYMSVMRTIQKCLIEHYNNCREAADSNMYTLQYLGEMCGQKKGHMEQE